MKVAISRVAKYKIYDLKHLDPITVFLEDLEKRKGKITIECYGKSWSSYWGGMGNRDVRQFFCSCDNGYLVNSLSPGLSQTVTDEEGLTDHAKKHILKLRKDNDIDEEEARELWDEVNYTLGITMNDHKLLHKVFGDEWWYCLPEKPNHEYEYLDRIVSAVKEGLK